MAGARAGCLSDDELFAFAQGQLSEARIGEAERHVSQCAACRRTIAETAKYLADNPASSAATVVRTVDLGIPPAATSRPLLSGESVGRYAVEGVLGAGGMGVVYAARDPELDRKIALKVLRGDAVGDPVRARDRLLLEAKTMGRLSHPNVVTVFDVGTADDRVFIAMELVAGSTLRRWVAEQNPGWRGIVRVFLEAGRGLAAAHDAGIVHRDFKPENVLVGADRVRVSDFGLARAEDLAYDPDVAPPSARTFAGTPAYMAPEQLLRDPVDARTDQYAFALTLYEALYRERPFVGSSVEALTRAVLDGAIRPAPEGSTVPAPLRAAIVKALGVDPASRYASMNELLGILEALVAEPPAERPRSRRLAIAGAIGVIVAAGGAASIWALRASAGVAASPPPVVAVAPPPSAPSSAPPEPDPSVIASPSPSAPPPSPSVHRALPRRAASPSSSTGQRPYDDQPLAPSFASKRR